VKPKNLCLVAAIMALSLVTGLLTPSSTAHAQVLPTVPHYECYDIVPATLPTLPSLLILQTQFGIEIVHNEDEYTKLCLPACKKFGGRPWEGDLNAPHVECLPIAGESPLKIVHLLTQFGIQNNVEVGDPVEACMPATKAIYPEEPQLPPPLVPHYECYNIRAPRPSGLPPGATVNLVTQFIPEPPGETVTVGNPTRLCLPALKKVGENWEGSLSAPHVECFAITIGTPVDRYVNLLTQFEPVQEYVHVVGPPTELCVPVLKTVVDTSIGGIAEAPDADASALGATASDGGSSNTTYAVIAGIAAGLVLLAAGGLYARRRWGAG